jgi:hypothetical protein
MADLGRLNWPSEFRPELALKLNQRLQIGHMPNAFGHMTDDVGHMTGHRRWTI